MIEHDDSDTRRRDDEANDPLAAGLALAVGAAAALAQAQGYPRKPILMLVPLQAASAVDNAAPDGYTIGGFNDSIMTMLPNIHQKLAWDVLRDFDPVSLVAQGFTVRATSPEDLGRITRDQLERYRALFRQTGIKAD